MRKDNLKLTEQLSDVAEKYKEREQQYFKTLEMVQEQEKLMRQKVTRFYKKKPFGFIKLNYRFWLWRKLENEMGKK